jgi:hypothetical protein
MGISRCGLGSRTAIEPVDGTKAIAPEGASRDTIEKLVRWGVLKTTAVGKSELTKVVGGVWSFV